MKIILSDQNVFEYLISQGLCTAQDVSLSNIELKAAKNFNLLISLPNGQKLLVKQERVNRDGKTIGEFESEWQVHNLCQSFSELSHLCSSLSEAVLFDEENSILVFNYLNEYRDLGNFYAYENVFPVEIPRSIGTTLASIHRLTFHRQDYRHFLEKSEESVDIIPNLARGLDKITPEVFGKLPGEGLKFFTLYQRYDNLGQAIANLSESFRPCCLTHNDLKLNNILLSLNWEQNILPSTIFMEGTIRFIDWERANWGDPASDLGAVIASYLQIWLYSMVASKTIPIEECLRLAAVPLQLLQPSLRALVTGYLAEFPSIFEYRPNFLSLVLQFSGFALIRSIQATLQHEKSFGNTGICILQVAKSLLCRPQASINTIFGISAEELIATSLSLI
jgi:hypothetical protein